MKRHSLLLLLSLSSAVIGASCGVQEPAEPESAENDSLRTEEVATAVADTATEVAFYGVVSWLDGTSAGGQRTLFALMPDTRAEADCLKDEIGQGAPERHHPVLKVVTGENLSWENGQALPSFQGNRIFDIEGQDVTIEGANLLPLAIDPANLAQLSSTAVLNAKKSSSIGSNQAMTLDPALLADPLPAGLGARTRFTHGQITASATANCYGKFHFYLAEQNTTKAGSSEPDCPIGESITPTKLADEMVVRLRNAGEQLKIRFRQADGTERALTVDPSASGGVRVEIGHQMEMAARHLDTRHPTPALCAHRPDLRDYLWYYDLRQGAPCPQPTLFPCVAQTLGGTKCPQNNGGG